MVSDRQISARSLRGLKNSSKSDWQQKNCIKNCTTTRTKRQAQHTHTHTPRLPLATPEIMHTNCSCVAWQEAHPPSLSVLPVCVLPSHSGIVQHFANISGYGILYMAAIYHATCHTVWHAELSRRPMPQHCQGGGGRSARWKATPETRFNAQNHEKWKTYKTQHGKVLREWGGRKRNYIGVHGCICNALGLLWRKHKIVNVMIFSETLLKNFKFKVW